ncbi:MAG: ABC transporter ATP-binding protein [Bacilli bacterium]|nr:ABC transporter ATP-binding protein [Bacilli bacterium]MDD3305112.1 ABC transporter ATP-binding protein [Bacilli bacterium]MDD4053355.1 ABC transporter ATP-binding protein [Bacilli bacterium]MDD4410998.1 ABC transporter ATP-binding protein [Bacilli bacterium]
MKTLLDIKNLRKKYHTDNGEIEAIKNFTFSLNEGTFVAIVGPSGCGKSTILSILCNIENKSNGELTFCKENIQFGYMLQQDTLFPWLNVLDNSLLGLKINGNLNKETKRKVMELIKTYGLSDFVNYYPAALSGGMRQRVALIRTLAINPDILLLDEAFSSLDYQTRLEVSNDVYKIIKREKKTTIMVTHDISEAISMADIVIVLSNRPSVIKNIYKIELNQYDNPIDRRTDEKFNSYYKTIWKDLDIHV